MPIEITSIISVVAAIAVLGTTSFGLVDATKAFGGGISLAGLGDIHRAIAPLFGGAASKKDLCTPLTYGSVYASLKSNWLNGVELEEQKATAAVLIRLSLSATTAPHLARATGVSPDVLTELAVALNIGAALTKEETDTLSRFETALNLILERGFQRADQRYRSSAKALAGGFSVVIAIIAGGAIPSSGLLHLVQGPSLPYWNTGNFWLAVSIGLLATPLAPAVKDAVSVLTAHLAVARNITAK